MANGTNGNGTVYPWWWKALISFGLPTLALIVLVRWLAVQWDDAKETVVRPAIKKHFETVDNLNQQLKDNTKALEGVAEQLEVLSEMDKQVLAQLKASDEERIRIVEDMLAAIKQNQDTLEIILKKETR